MRADNEKVSKWDVVATWCPSVSMSAADTLLVMTLSCIGCANETRGAEGTVCILLNDVDERM
jgi:hypothetical protein